MIDKTIFSFLKNYSTDEYAVNRLIVSSFLNINKIDSVKNLYIKNLIIKKDELEFAELNKFLNLLNEFNTRLDFEHLLELFEFVISPSDKLVNGAVYTPKDIRGYITNESFKEYGKINNSIKVVDISCGCGGFLIDASLIIKSKTAKKFKSIFKNNIYGIDIQKYSIERTKILLTLLAINNNEDEREFDFNLFAKDSLTFNLKEVDEKINKNSGFDIILGNPPYVCSRNMDENTKRLVNNFETCKSGHPDLYIPFFQIGYELLNKKGILGYITVNTFVKSLNGRSLREYFEKNSIDLKIIDFEDEQIFKSRMTYTAICFLSKKKSNIIKYSSTIRSNLNKELNYIVNNYKDLDFYKGWSLKNKSFINKIESVGIPLGEIYSTRSGIATLKNNIYIFKPIKETKKLYYIDENTKIEKDICKDVVNSNLLVKQDNISSIIEKVIFPYRYDENNQFYVIDEKDLQKNYPHTYKYLSSNKDLLYQRDKNKGKNYKYWYAFGRNQSLEKSKYKLLFPQLAKEKFKTYISDDENLYFYNGMAVLSDNLEELQILQKIFLSDVFWKYISSVSKNYASGYFSLGRNYIKEFGVYNFSKDEIKFLINETNINTINDYLNRVYGVFAY